MLSKEELVVGYTLVCKNRDEAIENVDKIMDVVDINRSGKVDFTGYLSLFYNRVYYSCDEQGEITVDRENDISIHYHRFSNFR